MYVYIYILHILEKKFELSIHVHACMHVCMDVCREKQINIVLNEICTQLGMLRCKVYVVVFLGEPNA